MNKKQHKPKGKINHSETSLQSRQLLPVMITPFQNTRQEDIDEAVKFELHRMIKSSLNYANSIDKIAGALANGGRMVISLEEDKDVPKPITSMIVKHFYLTVTLELGELK